MPRCCCPRPGLEFPRAPSARVRGLCGLLQWHAFPCGIRHIPLWFPDGNVIILRYFHTVWFRQRVAATTRFPAVFRGFSFTHRSCTLVPGYPVPDSLRHTPLAGCYLCLPYLVPGTVPTPHFLVPVHVQQNGALKIDEYPGTRYRYPPEYGYPGTRYWYGYRVPVTYRYQVRVPGTVIQITLAALE